MFAIYVVQAGVANLTNKDKFMPGTVINTANGSINVSGKTMGEVVLEYNKSYLPNYPYIELKVPTIKTVGGEAVNISIDTSSEANSVSEGHTKINAYTNTPTIKDKVDIHLAVEEVDTSKLTDLFKKQRYLGYLSMLDNPNEEILSPIVVEADKLESLLVSEPYLSTEKLSEPIDAFIDFNSETGEFEIIEEDDGWKPDVEKLASDIASSIESSSKEDSYNLLDYNTKAEVKKDNEELLARLDKLNQAVSCKITYDILGNTEVLDSNTYKEWMTFNEDGTYSIDRDKVVEYVDGLREKYNTANTTREFVNSYGETIEVIGPYGYAIGEQAETDKILEDIEAGNVVTREPEWFIKVNVPEGKKVLSEKRITTGDYIEVSIENQHVFVYKDGELVFETDCVTGTPNKERATHPGIFPINYMTKNATLKGPGYSSFVNYWMPFDGGIGLHDATWRGSFGGKIYKTNGSHGCVNLPLKSAKTIYENAYQGMAVIVY